MSSVDRTGVVATLRANGQWAVWRQVDAAGLQDPVEVAEFVLRRLYPNERASWYTDVLDQLRAARAAGTWSGFARPGPSSSEQSQA